MKTQKTYCVSHEPPLVPEHLIDYTIGVGGYRPERGIHVSCLDSFWDEMRPVAYGAAGNYVIPKVIDSETERPDYTGVFSHRKIVCKKPMGREAARYPVYREISPADALRIVAKDTRPDVSCDFLIGPIVTFPKGVAFQYAEKHHPIDIFDYLSIAVRLGVLTSVEVRELTLSTAFVPGGCELGVYPTPWLYRTLQALETIGRDFVIQFKDRIKQYDNYQIRAVGFLAERLGSFLLIKELQRRYGSSIPRCIVGSLCVIVPAGIYYKGALADSKMMMSSAI